MFLVILLGIFVFVLLPLMLWGIYKCCGVKNQGTAGEPYSVAVSNHLFKDENALREDLPCQNCKLIEMGSMACYTATCPACGKPPPGGARVMRGECSDIRIPMPCKPSCLKGQKGEKQER